LTEPASAHQPVLLNESIAALNIRPDGFYIDTTFGRGGHSRAILGHLNEHGRLLALDQDPQAVDYGRHLFESDDRIEIVHCNFSQVANVVAERGMENRVEGVLMDLGSSAKQIFSCADGLTPYYYVLRDGSGVMIGSRSNFCWRNGIFAEGARTLASFEFLFFLTFSRSLS